MRLLIGVLSGIGLAFVTAVVYMVVLLVLPSFTSPETTGRAVGWVYMLTPGLMIAVVVAFGLGTYWTVKYISRR
jgi:hypothetical protein